MHLTAHSRRRADFHASSMKARRFVTLPVRKSPCPRIDRTDCRFWYAKVLPRYIGIG